MTFTFDPVKHVYTLDGKPLTGVTTILGVIAKPALIQWAANQTVEYIKKTAPADTLKEDGAPCFVVRETVLEEARYAHRKKKEDAADSGTDLHTLAEGYVRLCIQENEGKPMEVCPTGLERLRDWAKKNDVKFLATEKRMYSRTWWIAGTCDLLFEKDGKKYIGDVKTYAKIWDRVPFFQAAGYANMYEEMNEGKDTIAGYCVLRLSKDGSFEEKWSFDVEGDTKAFFAAVELYRQLQTYKV